MKKTALIFIAFLFIFSATYSQDGLPSASTEKEPTSFLAVPAGLKSSVKNFFNLISRNEIEKAYDNILTGSPISRQRGDVDNLRSQTKRALEVYGQLNDYEGVNAEIATDSYIRLRYLGLHSSYPVRWIFTFYRSPEKGWIVTNIKFDDLSEYFFKGD